MAQITGYLLLVTLEIGLKMISYEQLVGIDRPTSLILECDIQAEKVGCVF